EVQILSCRPKIPEKPTFVVGFFMPEICLPCLTAHPTANNKKPLACSPAWIQSSAVAATSVTGRRNPCNSVATAIMATTLTPSHPHDFCPVINDLLTMPLPATADLFQVA
ncbi:hypothetical protein, partial [Enterobacter sp.]|uniref:hypothetical protein n=1 Tax=Enterobacter sp. TaxID=42895 RepID=UPI00296E2D25